MKHYLTYYEKELLEHIDLLKQHIAERNQHLIKVNGYAPSDPARLDNDLKERTEFKMKLISEEQFHKSFYISRSIYNANHSSCLFLVKKERTGDYFNGDVLLFVSDIRKLRAMTGVIEGRINDRGEIQLNELPKLNFPADLFTDIALVNPPVLNF